MFRHKRRGQRVIICIHYTLCLVVSWDTSVTFDSWLGWNEPTSLCHSANFLLISPQGVTWAAQQVWNLQLLTWSQNFHHLPVSLYQLRNQILTPFHSTDHYKESGVWRYSLNPFSWTVTKLLWWRRTFIKTTFIADIMHLQEQINMQKIFHCISKYRRIVTPLTLSASD